MIDIDTQDLTDEGYDLADTIELWLESHPGLHTPSAIGRGVKATSTHAWQILCWMEKRIYVVADGNGNRRKYGARRVGYGEYRTDFFWCYRCNQICYVVSA